MKGRSDFVTNSSSTAYIIFNKTAKKKTLAELVNEIGPVVMRTILEYFPETTLEHLLISSNQDKRVFYPGETYVSFGAEEGTPVGRALDYALREGGETKNFKWSFREWLR